MLWTTPESLRETQPVVSQADDVFLTADARIDNRDELRATLGLSTPLSRDTTDSELILAAYEKWGIACPEKLLGDFAFAIWDGYRQRLFCARDSMGVKPFYYYYHAQRVFVFASEIKALFCLPEVPRRLNEVMVANYLVPNFADRSVTFYQDIVRLPAAHCLIVSHGKIKLQPYWALDPRHEVRLRSDAEYAEAFREIFTVAVRCRLRSAFPVGSALSGGLDSSSIACTARRLLATKGKQRLHTFSAIFSGLPQEDLRRIDERCYVEAVLAKGEFEPHYVHADRLSPLTEFDRVLWHADEAVCAPNLYMHWALYDAAHQQGVRIFLDGIDGDTTVSHGFEALAEYARTGRWKTLVVEAAALAKRSNPLFTPRRILWQFGFRPLIPESAVHFWRLLRGRSQPIWAVSSVVNQTFARRVRLAERMQALLGPNSVPVRTAREVHWHSLTSALIPYGLEFLDKAATTFALEPRYPFFDRRLIEFCLALPVEQKLYQGWSRVVMRRAMAGILPPEVQWRPYKANLSPNFNRKLLEYERETLEGMVLNNSRILEEYVDMPTLHAAYRRYASQPTQRGQEALTVFIAVTLALWLRQSGLTS
jgi:asparagine synthase (glutamine-hydrolysing)